MGSADVSRSGSSIIVVVAVTGVVEVEVLVIIVKAWLSGFCCSSGSVVVLAVVVAFVAKLQPGETWVKQSLTIYLIYLHVPITLSSRIWKSLWWIKPIVMLSYDGGDAMVVQNEPRTKPGHSWWAKEWRTTPKMWTDVMWSGPTDENIRWTHGCWMWWGPDVNDMEMEGRIILTEMITDSSI